MVPSLRRIADIVGTTLAIGGLFFGGFFSGGDIWTVSIVPLVTTITFFEGSLTVVVFTLVVGVTGSRLVYDVWSDDGSADRITSGPPVRAIVPAYRDADVVDASVESLRDSEYDPLAISIVVEPSDRRTRERARELAARYDRVEYLVNDEPGSKATAINRAVHRTDADYFVAFDADEEVTPEFVSVAMGELLDGTDVFQGRRIPRPTGPVETLAYCERLIVQAGYVSGELFGFTHCQSSATAFTRDAFEAVGGYDDVLTEDIDFSHKCYRADLTVTQNRRCTSTMEAPHTVRDLWGQRKRWRIGHVEVFHRRIRDALDGEVGLSGLATVGRAVGGVVGGGFLLVVASHVLFLSLIDAASALLVPFACVLAMIVAVWSRDIVAGRIGLPSWTILLFPAVYLGHGVLTVKAVSEYYLTWSGEWYQVTKTGT